MTLGGPSGAPPFVVLSGPNMGGKSTMLRQCCLATLMAQVKGERGRGGLASLNSSYKCLRDFLVIELLHPLLIPIKTPVPSTSGRRVGPCHLPQASPRGCHLCSHGSSGQHHGGTVHILRRAGRDCLHAPQGFIQVIIDERLRSDISMSFILLTVPSLLRDLSHHSPHWLTSPWRCVSVKHSTTPH